jgi:hypothetical protein
MLHAATMKTASAASRGLGARFIKVSLSGPLRVTIGTHLRFDGYDQIVQPLGSCVESSDQRPIASVRNRTQKRRCVAADVIVAAGVDAAQTPCFPHEVAQLVPSRGQVPERLRRALEVDRERPTGGHVDDLTRDHLSIGQPRRVRRLHTRTRRHRSTHAQQGSDRRRAPGAERGRTTESPRLGCATPLHSLDAASPDASRSGTGTFVNADASTQTCTNRAVTASVQASPADADRRTVKRVVRDVVPTFSLSTTINTASPQRTESV